MTDTAFGIDLGTTFVKAAWIPSGALHPVALGVDDGQKTLLPSRIFLRKEHAGMVATVGRRADELLAASLATSDGADAQLVSLMKRAIGDTSPTASYWTVAGQRFSAECMSSVLLRKVRQMTGEYKGVELERAVVTYPRNFSLAQKNATAAAVRAAGIDLLEMVAEPEAAARAFFRHGEQRPVGTYVIFDLGGGTLDISVIRVEGESFIQVIGGAGDNFLGGSNFDDKLLELIFREAAAYHRMSDYQHRLVPASRSLLQRVAIETKVRFGDVESLNRLIDSHFVSDGLTQTPVTLRRSDWEESCRSLVERCVATADRALSDAGVRLEDVRLVIPVGGSCRLALVQKAMRERFRERWAAPDDYVPLDHAVAYGAAFRAQSLLAEGKLRKGGVSDAERARLRRASETMSSSLPKDYTIMVWRNGGFELDALARKNTPLPLSSTMRYRVDAGNRLGDIKIYEAEPGPVGRGYEPTPSAILRFPNGGIPVQPGDIVAVTLTVAADHRVSGTALHENSGAAAAMELSSAPGASGSSPADCAATLSSIEVN